MNSDTADLLWKQAEPHVFITREQFIQSFHGWDVREVMVGGRVAFVTAVKGAEFHFASLDTGAHISRRMIRDFLAPLIAQYGHATTRAPKDDFKQDRFNRAFGFTVTGQDEFHWHYTIKRLPQCH